MNQSYSGALALLVYCLSTGLSGVWVFFDLSDTTTPFWALAFIIFGAAASFFWVIQIIQGDDPWRLIRRYPKEVLILNILTAITWLAMFAAILLAEASFESAICQGWIPMSVLACDLIMRQTKWMSLRSMGVLGIAVSLFILVALRVVSGEWLISSLHLQQGIGLATLAGIASGLYIFYSSCLHQKPHCSTLDILSTRFLLTLGVSALFGIQDIVALCLQNPALLGQLLVLSIVSVILPALMFQHAIAKLGDARVSLITPLVPVLSLATEMALGHWRGFMIPFLITMTCLAVILSNIGLRRSA